MRQQPNRPSSRSSSKATFGLRKLDYQLGRIEPVKEIIRPFFTEYFEVVNVRYADALIANNRVYALLFDYRFFSRDTEWLSYLKKW